MSDQPGVIARFVSLNPGEEPGREYQVLIANHRRWTLRGVGLAVLVALVATGIATSIAAAITADRHQPDPAIAAAAGIGMLALLLLRLALRRLKTVHGTAMVTNRRVLYYEYCLHPAENYHHTKQANVGDIAGVRLYIEQARFGRRFVLTLWSQASSALHIAGERSWRTRLAGGSREPGRDTTAFVQDVSSIIIAKRLAGGAGGSATSHT